MSDLLLPLDDDDYREELYADGGVIGVNPSPVGGTYAWCFVEGGKIVQSDARKVLPSGIGTRCVTNNNTELLALLQGFEHISPGWKGRVNSDSQLALGWVFLNWKLDNVPTFLRECVIELRQSGKLRGVAWRLLQGHPTKADLERGYGKKRGFPVSEWNVWCDESCQRIARAAQEETRRTAQTGVYG